jgi:type I restriction enzyme M protein
MIHYVIHKKHFATTGRNAEFAVRLDSTLRRHKWRIGIIVPEGNIFQSGTGHKQLRKNLVEDGLYAVVSLPQGVFAPYSGVKTSILLFNNELAKMSKEILFVKIESDGFDLGAQRRVSIKNDLPQALTVLNKWNTGEKVENKLAVYVEKSKIAENGEYNLSVERYRIATDYTNAKWSMVKLGDVCDVYQPKTITSNQIKESGKYKVFGANGVIGYFDQYNHEEAEVAVTCRGATCGTVNFTEPRSWITGNAMVIKPKENNLNKRYLFFLLRSTDLTSVITGAAQPQITGSALKPFLIPLPPLEIQEQLVAELDGYAGIVAGAKQITQHWRPKIDIDPEWEKVKIGDICIIGYLWLRRSRNNRGQVCTAQEKEQISFIEIIFFWLNNHRIACDPRSRLRKINSSAGSATTSHGNFCLFVIILIKISDHAIRAKNFILTGFFNLV